MLHVESLNCTQQAIKDVNPLLFTIKLRIPIFSSTSDKYPENGKLPTCNQISQRVILSWCSSTQNLLTASNGYHLGGQKE